jgi:hypothetical protein
VGIFRRLFRLGVLPAELRTQVDAEGILAVFENLPVTYRFSGRVPGHVAVGQVRPYSGALAFTSVRALGTLAWVPNTGGKAMDVPWTTGDDGAVHVTIHPDGVKIAIDLERVSPGEFTGTQSLDYKCPLAPEVLARLPKLEFGFDIPREYVLKLAGVPVRPKKA